MAKRSDQREKGVKGQEEVAAEDLIVLESELSVQDELEEEESV